MFEKIENCPICSSPDIENYIICKDHMLSGESFAITKCTSCSFLFTNPRPNSLSIAKYYQSEEYISHENKVKNLTTFLYKAVRHITLTQKLKLINSISQEKTIMDFGCGTGDFLSACKNNSWEIYGFEPEAKAREQAIIKTKKNIYSLQEEIKEMPKVDLITLWHVLEHIHELNPTLDFLKSKLSKTGKLLIAVPNHDSYDAKYYRQYWAAYDVPRHLYHFTMKTMKKLLHNHGLKINQILPMKFDSYYVSLLSEKYKTGNQNYTKSFITGYKSNIYAVKNKNNYSSLIYIAGK